VFATVSKTKVVSCLADSKRVNSEAWSCSLFG